jgi:hypothetical protein
MKFKYKDFGKKTFRPVITVKLTYKNTQVEHNVLIDSGADFSLFSYDVAQVLNIPIETGVKSEAYGITGGGSPIYIHPITITVGKTALKVKAGFIENMTNAGYGIVGQVGFFDKFEVKFDYQNKEIELIEKKKKARHNLFWSALTNRKTT